MSFYGSTYFQLIDTFYKILVKNKGNSANTVSDAPATANEYASQASGRKGILEFGTGNRWIYATQDASNPNSYIFWHAKPDSKNLTKQEFKGGLQAKDVPAGATVITLEPDSYIKAPQFEFDKAGHVAIANDVYYKMPISETEQAIEDLQAKVGEPIDSKTEDLFTRAKNADDAIIAVTGTADRLRDELGSYSTVFPDTGAYKYVNNTNMYKDFFATFGSMDKFRTALYEDAESSKSLIDGIVEFRASALEDIATNADNIGVQSRLANRLTDDLGDAKDAIKALQEKDTEIDGSISTLSTNLVNTAKDIRSEFKEVDDAIKESIKTCNGRIDDLNTTVGSNKSNLENSINNLTDTVNSNKNNCDNRMKAIEDNADRLEGLIEDSAADIIELTGVVADNKTAAEDAASKLSDRITDLETNGATSEALNGVFELVGQNATAIGLLSGRIDEVDENASSAIGSINQTIAQLNNTISNKADNSAVSALETSLNNYITSVNNALDLKADKSTVTQLQTALEEKANATSVTELIEVVAQKASQTEVNTLTELVNTKADQISLNDLAAAVDTKAGLDTVEKYAALENERISKLEAENLELRGLIEELTARIEALEKGPTTE